MCKSKQLSKEKKNLYSFGKFEIFSGFPIKDYPIFQIFKAQSLHLPLELCKTIRGLKHVFWSHSNILMSCSNLVMNYIWFINGSALWESLEKKNIYQLFRLNFDFLFILKRISEKSYREWFVQWIFRKFI